MGGETPRAHAWEVKEVLLKNSLREGVLYSMAHVYVGRDSSANMKVGWGGGGRVEGWWY